MSESTIWKKDTPMISKDEYAKIKEDKWKIAV